MYLHPSIKQNVGCLLADLYVALEARPFSKDKVRRPGVKKNQVIEVPDPGETNKQNDTSGKLGTAPLHSRYEAMNRFKITYFYPLESFVR